MYTEKNKNFGLYYVKENKWILPHFSERAHWILHLLSESLLTLYIYITNTKTFKCYSFTS